MEAASEAVKQSLNDRGCSSAQFTDTSNKNKQNRNVENVSLELTQLRLRSLVLVLWVCTVCRGRELES